MKEKEKWSDAKIQGAKQHCLKKRLTKSCPYENVKKYLVLVSDDVEKLALEYSIFFLLCLGVFFSKWLVKVYIVIFLLAPISQNKGRAMKSSKSSKS